MYADPREEVEPQGSGPLGSIERYTLAVVITAVAVLSQYFLPQLVPAVRPAYASLLGGLFIVYGIPILACLALIGRRPLDRFATRLVGGFPSALAWYGALSLVALGVAIGLFILYELLDPAAIDLLSRPNPAIQEAASNPWLWVAFSFAIGAIEETIFRGWIFGYWIARGSSHLGWHAVWTSALFAGVHLYYGLTYGIVSPIAYSQLFLLGLAFAMAVRANRGNLVWVAVLHGANDATAFLTILSPVASAGLHYAIVLIGGAIALWLYLQSRSRPVPNPPPGFSPLDLSAPAYRPPPPRAPLAVPVVPPTLPPPPPP